MSGALHTGVVASSWLIEKLLRALFKFLQILLPEEQSICVCHQLACIQKNSALPGGWRMKGLLLRSGVILLSW